MPIKRAAIGHPGSAEAIRLLGAWDRVVGRDYYTTDEILFPGALNLPVCSGKNLYQIDYDAVSRLNPDIYLTSCMPLSGFLDVADVFRYSEIPIVALNFDNPKTLQNNIRLLRYILDSNEDGEDFIASYENLKNEITAKTDMLSEDEKPRVFIWYFDYDHESCYRTIGRDATGIQAQFDIVGINNIFADKEGMFPTIKPGTLAGEDIDAIICLISPAVIKDIFGYGIDDNKRVKEIKAEIMSGYRNSALEKTTAVKKERIFLIQNEMVCSPRQLVSLAYMAKWTYSDFFMHFDPHKIHQKYLTEFMDINCDLNKQGVFCWWVDKVQEWSDHECAEGEYINVYSSAAARLVGIWSDEDEKWYYVCHICSGGAVRLIDELSLRDFVGCFSHSLEIIKKENKENFNFDIYDDNPERMGCRPHSGEEEDYSTVKNIIEALANVVINSFNSYVSFTWAIVSPFTDDLVSAIDKEELEDEQLTCKFLYEPDKEMFSLSYPSDVGCWYWWKVYVNSSQTVKFDIYDTFTSREGTEYFIEIQHHWAPIINCPPSNPCEMSAVEKKKYGIEEIPVSEIKTHTEKLVLSSTLVDELVELGEPVYIVKSGIVIEKYPTEIYRTDLASIESESDRRASNE